MNDFTAGMAYLLAPDGVITLEFPHLERLIEDNQFDTIYHEHFSYFSLLSAEAGSRYAFNKTARALSAREAALLAAVLPNPRRRSAKQPGPAVRRLAGIYETRGAAQAALAYCAKTAAASRQ